MGKKGVLLSDETKAKISAAKRGRKLSREHIASSVAGRVTAGSGAGSTMSPQAKARVSAGMIGRTSQGVRRSALINSQSGGARSEEHKKAISEKLKGRKFSDETRKKMSEAKKGRKISEETKAKISSTMKGRSPSEKTKEAGSIAKRAKAMRMDVKQFKQVNKIQPGQKLRRPKRY